MPNIAKVIKEEISRISRHEAKVAVTPIRKPTIRLRRDVAALKTRLAALEKAFRDIQALMAKCKAAQPAPAPEAAGKGWIFYLMAGHAASDYSNSVYRQIIENCLTWQPGMCAKQDISEATTKGARE